MLDNTGQINRQTLKKLFDRLMTLNPSMELYLVSPVGQLLADAAPPGRLKRHRINVAPLQTFLSGSVWPVYGDDPRSLDQQKVFSVAPIETEGKRRGFLYIVLQGEDLNSLADRAWEKTLWDVLIWTLLLVMLFGFLGGLLVWYG